jgi:hypothetical protein
MSESALEKLIQEIRERELKRKAKAFRREQIKREKTEQV